MPRRDVASRLIFARRYRRAALLAGTSVVTLALAATPADARQFGNSSTSIAPPTVATDAATEAAQQAAKLAKQARDSLSRATQAIQAMQGAQAAARAAAQAAQKSATLPTAIPNGLGAGGLLPNVPAGWSGAGQPTQAVDSTGQTNVNINQAAAQAILNWTTFNVGARTTLTFDQHGNAAWVALNRVDASTGPSQILGNIKADGTVLVINQSGIIFGGASQINVGSLVASSAGITDDQFRAAGIYAAQVGSVYVPSFTGAGEGATGGLGGKVIVEPGALITTSAPTAVTQGGGYVLLMGTEVDNAGSITTPKGQVELAAAHDFVLRTGFATDSNQYSTTRGNEIATGTWVPNGSSGTWTPGGGTVTNAGIAFAQQGDITLAGHTIIQDGVLVSTTSVNQRGTIHLLNSATDATGSITLTGNSLALILPELDSTDTALNSQRDALIAASGQNLLAIGQFNDLSSLADRQDQSRVEIVTGGTVDFRNGSLTQAQGGQVSVSAVQRIFTESGATIDVSGVQGVLLPMSANEIQVNIQGNELRDSPANRDSGNLMSKDVWIDVRDLILVPSGTGGYASDRYYTPGGLLEVSGYLSNTAHGIGEWTAVGGSITLSAAEVVAQQGSIFNISGGSVQYQGGYLQQTYVIGSDGGIYNINDAPSGIAIKAVANGFVVDHAHWGVTEIYQGPWGNKTARWEDGYTVGRDAGSLILSTPTSVFEGDIVAGVIDGERQTDARPSGVTDGYKLPQDAAPLPGTLALGQYIGGVLAGGYNTDVVIGNIASVASGMTATGALPSDRVNTAWFDATTINGFNLGGVNVITSKGIEIDAPLNVANGGQVTLTAPLVNVNADVTAHAGSVTVSNLYQAPNGPAMLATPSGTAQLTLGSGATIDVSGLWVNGAIDPGDLSNLAFLNGGNVNFSSTQDVTIASGSVIDVSSGGAILANGKTQGGSGGNVTIAGGVPAVTLGASGLTGAVALDGQIRAYGVNGGGTLTISTPGLVQVGDNASLVGGTVSANTPTSVALILKQSLTIPAGQPLPMPYVDQISVTPLDTPLPGGVTPGEQRPPGPGNVPGVTVEKDWQVPAGINAWDYSSSAPKQLYRPGDIVPAGTNISTFTGGAFPPGYIVPSDTFPNGIKTATPIAVMLAAGTVRSTATTYAAGAIIPVGTSFNQDVAVEPTIVLNSKFFALGFSNYDITGRAGVEVLGGTALAPSMPVYQFTADSFSAPSGTDPSQAMSLWLPPLFIENRSSGTLTQRAGVSLALRSFTSGLVGGSGVVVDDGASIAVDHGQSIKLDGFNQVTVNGDLTAHGGNISLIVEANGSTEPARNFDSLGNPRPNSVWVGDGARIDVSGQAITATDVAGRIYGNVTNGGSISLNGNMGFVIIRPGAELDADGAGAIVNSAAGVNPAASGQPLALASNGGSIAVSSDSGIYMDGNLHAVAGGPGAAGGSLSVSMILPLYPQDVTFIPPNEVPSTIVVQQARPDAPSLSGPGADGSLLKLGQATVSADMVKDGGFDTLSLNSGFYMRFTGDVSLKLGQSLSLSAAAFITGDPITSTTGVPVSAIPGNHVQLSAPYISLNGPYINIPPAYSGALVTSNPSSSGMPTAATFEVEADQIDVGGLIQFSSRLTGQLDGTTGTLSTAFAPGFADVTLRSQGDIRFLPSAAPQGATFQTDGNIDLLAAQIYPVTNAAMTVTAGQNNPNDFTISDLTPKLTIGRTTDTIPDAPLSVFGRLSLAAPIVEQGGIVRAPFGQIILGTYNYGLGTNQIGLEVDLLPGSLTSVSTAGMVIPYGGTVDGITYNYNGASITPRTLIGLGNGSTAAAAVTLDTQYVNVQSGATLDLSGGGTLTGAGFVSGRGGSVNVITTPLVNANPTTPVSKASDKVYAIVPGYISGYAPIAPENGAGDPSIGQQITVPAGVSGLPAGTYTLLPANYALLPGAYRVELGGTTTQPVNGASPVGNGTYVSSAYISIADTSIRSALPVTMLITPGAAVRSYSQYDEQSYSDFMTASTAQFGAVRPLLPVDGKTLVVQFEAPTSSSPTSSNGSTLTFDGKALFQADQGGVSGEAIVTKAPNNNEALEVVADQKTSGFTGASVGADDLNGIGAPRLLLNSALNLQNNAITVGGSGNVFVRDGVMLTGSEIFIGGSNITVGNGVTLSSIGQGAAPFDSDTTGLSYAPATMLMLSNGNLNFVGSTGSGSITIGANSQLYSEGTLAIATGGTTNIDPTASFGSRNITLAVGTLNIGSAADIAAAGNPSGVRFDQALFNTLANGDPLHHAPALQAITLAASQSINLFGDADLDATGSHIDLVLNASAIYGYGAAGDHATIAAGKITWNAMGAGAPPAISPGGPGTGSGTFDLVADEIDLGQFVSLDTSATSRVIYGFENVNITGRSQIISAGNSKLFVYQASSTANGAAFGQSGVGGNLTLFTPLLTGVQKSIMAYSTGGALDVVAPAGIAPSAAKTTVSGAEIDLTGDGVAIATTILLPSGKLVVNATHDIALNDGSRIDLSGQPSMIQKATVYGFGGTATFTSAQGSLTQSAGSTIDVSATNANAGSLTISAGNGVVSLGGALNGAANDGYVSGDFSLTTGTLSDAEFASLNAVLTQGGFFDARSFDIRNGDLNIGDGIRAHNVTVSVDGGSLTVAGTIDASGNAPGTIRLSANNGLTLNSGAKLDVHGNVLQVDSYGKPIEAENRGHIELTAAAGTLTLSPSATLDLTTPGGVAYGDVQLNAQRTGETSGDIAIAAKAPLNILGAYSIALNAFWTYNLTDGSVITQSTLNGYDAASTAFINAALGNSNLQSNIAGLSAYGSAFHLRPGVQITSTGDLSTSGDIDLTDYRYGPHAPSNDPNAAYGAGEPMALVIRAGGNLTIKGSVSDGFGATPGSPAVTGPIDVTKDPNTVFYSASDLGLDNDGTTFKST